MMDKKKVSYKKQRARKERVLLEKRLAREEREERKKSFWHRYSVIQKMEGVFNFICWKSFFIGFLVCYIFLGYYFGSKYVEDIISRQEKEKSVQDINSEWKIEMLGGKKWEED